MNQLQPELGNLYEKWLAQTIPAACRPHLYNFNHQHQVVFLMMTPLELLGQRERSPLIPYIQACRDHLLKWFTYDADIWREIAVALPANLTGGAISSLEEFVRKVYFTDCVKCEVQKKQNGRRDQKDFQYHRTHAAACLSDEFALLGSAQLFITIGSEAWEVIQQPDLVGPVSPVIPVGFCYQHLRAGEPRANSNLTDVHGVLFKGSGGRFVIPLCFPRGQTNPLRNSYLEYFIDGVRALKETDSQAVSAP